MANRMSAGVAKRLRTEVEEKLWKLPLNYYDTKKRGDIMSCATNDIDNVVTTLNSTGCDFFYHALTLVGIVVMMMISSWKLAMITIAVILLSFAVVRFITKKAKPFIISEKVKKCIFYHVQPKKVGKITIFQPFTRFLA